MVRCSARVSIFCVSVWTILDSLESLPTLASSQQWFLTCASRDRQARTEFAGARLHHLIERIDLCQYNHLMVGQKCQRSCSSSLRLEVAMAGASLSSRDNVTARRRFSSFQRWNFKSSLSALLERLPQRSSPRNAARIVRKWLEWGFDALASSPQQNKLTRISHQDALRRMATVWATPKHGSLQEFS
jgi:hypothetical protein